MENAYTSQKLLEVFKKDKTYENAKNYIISFICEYTGKQGYYDYYKLNNEWESVFKMRYRGKINHFKFISSPEPNHFIFSADGKAVIDLPTTHMSNEEKTKQSLYEEIQKRAPKDILNELKETICDDLDNFIKCKDLNIEVKIEWKFATNRVDID